MIEMLDGIKAVTTAGAEFTWVPADFLKAQRARLAQHAGVDAAGPARRRGFRDAAARRRSRRG